MSRPRHDIHRPGGPAQRLCASRERLRASLAVIAAQRAAPAAEPDWIAQLMQAHASLRALLAAPRWLQAGVLLLGALVLSQPGTLAAWRGWWAGEGRQGLRALAEDLLAQAWPGLFRAREAPGADRAAAEGRSDEARS